MSGAGAMLPDFTEALSENESNLRSPRQTQGTSGNRRETILNLVEMLLQSDELKRELTHARIPPV